jgi:hypothetical protein
MGTRLFFSLQKYKLFLTPPTIFMIIFKQINKPLCLRVSVNKKNRFYFAVEAVLRYKYLSIGLLFAEKSNYKG